MVQVDYYNIILFSIEYLMFTNDYLAKMKKKYPYNVIIEKTHSQPTVIKRPNYSTWVKQYIITDNQVYRNRQIYARGVFKS